jgi:hypothetical protein
MHSHNFNRNEHEFSRTGIIWLVDKQLGIARPVTGEEYDRMCADGSERLYIVRLSEGDARIAEAKVRARIANTN